MGFSDTQKAQALQAARTVQPIAEGARAEAKQIVQAARKADPTGTREQIRAAVKDQIKAVRERAASQILPSGRALLASLTPEQRAKIQERLAKHGKTFDEEKVARRLGFLLSRPGAVKFLESRTGPRTQR
jgi:Spy/CpxP family protein refolding chaperone